MVVVAVPAFRSTVNKWLLGVARVDEAVRVVERGAAVVAGRVDARVDEATNRDVVLRVCAVDRAEMRVDEESDRATVELRVVKDGDEVIGFEVDFEALDVVRT